MSPYVLVVESDPDIQKRVGDALREARYELAAETELAWAKRSLAVRAPEAVVIDTVLADGSGFAFAEQMRKDPETGATPIFFIASRYRGTSHRSEAMRRFAPAEYLPTPLDVDRLLALLLQRVPPALAPAALPSSALPAGVEEKRALPDRRVAPVADRRADGSEAAAVRSSAAPVSDEDQKRERRDVERKAKDFAEGDAMLRGRLRRTSFARILQRLYARGATGSLLLLREQTKKIVVFQGGYPLSVRSNVLAECLGQILLAKKLIGKEALDESLRRMKGERRQQGAILVEMGALSPYNLEQALTEQMEAKLFEPFAWIDGQFTFKEGPPPAGETRRLDRSTAALILEGIRRHYDDARQDAVLAELAGNHLALHRDPVLRLQEMTTDPAELSFIYGIDGTLRLETVLDQASIPRDKARVLLVALFEAAMIEPFEGSARRSITGVVPDPRPAGGRVATEPSRDQLAAIAATLRGQNHFDALGVTAEACTEEVAMAYEALAREFHPDRFRGREDDLRELAQEIFDRFTDAERVIGDAGRRKTYAARLQRAKARERMDRSAPSPLAEQYFVAGMEDLRSKRHRDAVEAFRQAARLVPDHASYRAALGWALYREAPADPRASRAAYGELRRAVELDANNHRARVYLGHFFIETGKPDQAIQELEAALRIKPGAADIEEELRRLRSAS